MKKITLLCSLLLLMTACAGTTKNHITTPDWVTGESKHHPKSLYLTGQGMGISQHDAKDRARADLAKQFQVAVQERSQQSQQFQSQTQGGETSRTLEQKISRNLMTFTSQSLEGIEIAQQWHDKEQNQYHALAVLSRNKAKQQFSQQVSTLDKEIQQHLAQAKRETQNLYKAGAAHKTLDKQVKRMALQRSLQVVDQSGRGIPSPVTLTALKQIRNEFLGRIKLSTQASNKELTRILKSETTKAGFQVLDDNSGDYTLVLSSNLDPMFVENDWHWLRGTLELRLEESDGNTVGVQRWPLKVSATTEQRARQRMVDSIQQTLANDLLEKILGFTKN